MNHLIQYPLFEGKLDRMPSETDSVWKTMNIIADRIVGKPEANIPREGYGKPLKELVGLEPSWFDLDYRGSNRCDLDVLFYKFHKLRQKNHIHQQVTFGERMFMLLSDWRTFTTEYNPKNLNFSDWLYEPQTLYRGMPEADYLLLKNENKLDLSKYYSFTFLPDIAKLFTIPGYGSGSFVTRKNQHGRITSTQACPIDFHIYVGVGISSDEMEVVLKAPIKFEIHQTVVSKEKESEKVPTV